MLIAHRGLISNKIKENTLESFVNAIRHNYDGVELDIRKTKDNVIVVLHDSFINRTSNGSGYIKNFTYKELLKYNFGTKKYKAKIPLLKDVLENLNNTNIIIELKEKFTEEELVKALKYNKNNNIYLCSFFQSHLDVIKNINYPKGLINYLLNSSIDYKKYEFYLLYYKFYNDSVLKRIVNIKKELFLYGIKNIKDLKDIKDNNSLINYIVER